MRLSSPSLTAESSPPVFSPLTPPLPMGRQRSHLTAEYTLSQALSLSLSHTFAPAPQCPFLNFSPSLHYLMLSISHFHALNLSYGSAPFHLLSVSLSFILPFSLHDSDNLVLLLSFVVPFWRFTPFPSPSCFVTVLSFPVLSHLDEQRYVMCILLPSLAPFIQPVQGGMLRRDSASPFYVKRTNTDSEGHRCSTIKPAAEVVTKLNRRLCKMGEPAGRDRCVPFGPTHSNRKCL